MNLSIIRTLKDLPAISLQEMDKASLMDRIDNKYIFPVKDLTNLLNEVKNDYFIFEINDKRISHYSTLYYDTQKLDLYHSHHSGKLNRYKVREREYTDSGICFFEIKFKNNKKLTIKRRIPVHSINNKIEGITSEFLKETSNLDAEDLSPTLWVDYDRITLVSKTLDERVTFDLNLTFSFDGKEEKITDLITIEAKRTKQTKSTPVIKYLKQNSIREGGFSKYCLGMASIYNELKANNFKKKFLKIDKTRRTYV